MPICDINISSSYKVLVFIKFLNFTWKWEFDATSSIVYHKMMLINFTKCAFSCLSLKFIDVARNRF